MLRGFSLTKGELLCLDKLMLCPLIRVTGAHATANQTLHTNYCSIKTTWSSPHTITHWCPKDPKAPEEPVHTLSSAKETGYNRAALELGPNRKQTQTQNTFLFPCYCTEDLYTSILVHQALLQRGFGPSRAQELSACIIPLHDYF